MNSGRFFNLVASAAWPVELQCGLPPVLWLPEVARSSIETEAALWGTCCDSGEKQALITLDEQGRLIPHFDIASTIQGILREDYHAGLEPTAEMQLPFNYSRLPSWIKALGRKLRSSSIAQPPAIAFPDHARPYVVAWLERLLKFTASADGRLTSASEVASSRWPDGQQAALVVTHDVDTDWVFRHPQWLERICQMEERYGIRGAWYCVPWNSQNRAAQRGMQALQERGCELGCHGFNHDAKFPLQIGRSFQQRMDFVKQFRERWEMRGFRSEWLFRTPTFLQAIAEHFDYDSSVPAVNPLFSRRTNNGCGACAPYRTHGGMWELPISIPMDEDRHLLPLAGQVFWSSLVERAEEVIDNGGLVVITLHPQPHQMANEQTIGQVEAVLERLTARTDLWFTRPADVVDWMQRGHMSLGKP